MPILRTNNFMNTKESLRPRPHAGNKYNYVKFSQADGTVFFSVSLGAYSFKLEANISQLSSLRSGKNTLI